MHHDERRARSGQSALAIFVLSLGVGCTEAPTAVVSDTDAAAEVSEPRVQEAQEGTDAAAHDPGSARAEPDGAVPSPEPGADAGFDAGSREDAGMLVPVEPAQSDEAPSQEQASVMPDAANRGDYETDAWTQDSPSMPAISEPQRVGTLVGPEHTPQDLVLHGTDLGFPVARKDDLLLFFGDTTEQANDICGADGNDDMLASIPREFPGEAPELDVRRSADDPQRFSPLVLMDGDESLSLSVGRVPIGGFSVGSAVYSLFNRLELVRCDPDQSEPGCGGEAGFRCVADIGECAPNRSVVVPPLCEMDSGSGCMPDQRCEPADTGFCIDPTSSQYDDTVAGNIASVVHALDLGVQRSDDPTVFDRVATFETNKFENVALAQIAGWNATREGNNYALGEQALLVWGRPGFTGSGAREAQLYLMVLPLPLPSADADSAVARDWSPSYFAGVDPDGEPRWSKDQTDAKPIAMDGVVAGDPHEDVTLVNQTSIAYVGGDVRKWVMLYGGDISDLLVQDAPAVRTGPSPGSIVLRVADYPWGPFTPPVPHLTPGDPKQVGTNYGPGGILYHTLCRDTASERCAPPNGTVNPLVCIETTALVDQGRLYGATILPSYIRENPGGGMDLFWNVSTWVPYSVVMFKTALGPAAASDD